MNHAEIEAYLASKESGRYERDEWDKFLSKKKFSLEAPAIHIAGTNGKGSTASYLANIYQASGRKVALFSKPQLYHVNEIIRINGEPISDADFDRIFLANKKEFEKYDLSAFEIEVFVCFSYINEQKVDLAIIECGMGGELDATNIFTPVLSIITSVSLEHTGYLGTTPSQIAYHKAGIIKEGVPVLVGGMGEIALDIMKEVAKDNKSTLKEVEVPHGVHLVSSMFHFDYWPFKDLLINTVAIYQIKNASLAIEATKILAEDFPVDEGALRIGLMSRPLDCRLERHGRVYIDGAHNPEAINDLLRSFNTISGGKPVHVVFASFRDKNIAVELPAIGTLCPDITLTTFPHPRAKEGIDYFLYEADYPFVEDYKEAISNALSKGEEDVVLITGSLAFAALAKDYVENELKL